MTWDIGLFTTFSEINRSLAYNTHSQALSV
jgi:hypothetical protein